MKQPSHRLFQNYIRFVIGFNLFVILWGAFVRASRSGAGCGDHWPLCSGQVIPSFQSYHTQIEFFHRVTSGFSLLLVLTAVYWTFQIFPKRSFSRKVGLIAGISILVEALIGAVLVLLRLVADNSSFLRAIVISIHFVNTLLLLGTLTLVSTSASREGQGWRLKPSHYKNPIYWIIGSLLVVSILGAMTALGDTLFPSSSLTKGMLADLNQASHFLIRLRFLHPVLAILFGFGLIRWVLIHIHLVERKETIRIGSVLVTCVGGGLFIGILNIVFLTPIALQMTHLAFALIIWISLVIYVDHLLSSSSNRWLLNKNQSKVSSL